MAFGRLGNRHDTWLAFCTRYGPLLADAGLPEAIVLREERFRDLLRDGSASGRGVAVSLAELPAERWAGLARFVAVFFRECESFAPLDLFPAYRHEAERRRASPEAQPDTAADRGPVGEA